MTLQALLQPFITIAFICLGLVFPSYSQKKPLINNVTLYQGTERINLSEFDEFHLVYHKTSQGLDSVSTEIFCKEIRARRDTLFVHPTDVTTFRLMDPSRPYSESKYYPNSTDTWIVVPSKELEYIKAKRQPIHKISSTVLSISYVTLLCSPFIAMSQNAEVSNFGINLFLVSVPVLGISWSTNAIWGKKKFRFDPKRTRKKTWSLSS